MMRLLRWLWTGDGHRHNWETRFKRDLYSPRSNDTPIGIVAYCTCKTCGRWKRFKLT